MAPSAPPPTPFRAITSLRLGERVLSKSDGGVLAAEYALFDVGDIVLRATDPVTVREAGYMTTAREGLERLGRLGVTPDLANEAARALAPEVVASYARGRAARSVSARLGPQELFDGAIYDTMAQRYEGAWLDLRALSGAVPLPLAANLLQAVHLVVTLSEVPPATPVHLSTAAVTRDLRPGERTHLRVLLDGAAGLPSALRRLRSPTHPIDGSDDRRLRQALLARLRERMSPDNSPRLQAHLSALESALGSRTLPIGPLADPDLRAIERQLASGDGQGVDDRLDQLEHERGRLPGIRYLRARAALLRGEEPPRSVAQALSSLADEEKGFHEAALVAARTWLAAGEEAHARYFAHKLTDDPSTKDTERLVALEILEATSGTQRSHIPPSVEAEPVPRIPQARAPLFPSLGSVPPPQTLPPAASIPPGPAPSIPSPPEPVFTWPARPQQQPSAPPPAAYVPLDRPDPSGQPTDPGAKLRRGLRLRYEPELVESLALPAGTDESTLGVNELPRSPLQARVAMTRLARDLARDYRLWYGKTLRCNVLAIDAMQQHLTHRFVNAPISDARVAWELRRHGALLSEILARALGAFWVDVAPSEPGYWTMRVPPSMKSWPIGRVYRFVTLGHHERDLVSYYLDIEARVRQLEV